jgi:uncharacterized protein
MEKEIRAITNEVELRSDSEGREYIEGYAIVFNELSHDFGGWRERISPDAINGADMSDVVALFNHDYDKLLGRSVSGTLKMIVDERGLKYRILKPNTTLGNDVYELIKRGDVRGSSFAFTVDEDGTNWERSGDTIVRNVTKFKRIYDVSPVTNPAYPDTTSNIAKRSFEEFINTDQKQTEPDKIETPKLNIRMKKLNLIEKI